MCEWCRICLRTCWIENLDREWLSQPREWSYSDCGRFALSILVHRTTLVQGEDFIVSIKLKNLGDYDIEIGFGMRTVFQGFISSWGRPFGLFSLGQGGASTLTIPANGYVHEVWQSGGWRRFRRYSTWADDPDFFMLMFLCLTDRDNGMLVEGAHELRFKASFTTDLTIVNSGDRHWPWPPEKITFYSNTVEIIVNEDRSGWFDSFDREWLNQPREWGYSDCGRFALSLLVYRRTLSPNESVVVSIKLKNLSSYDIEIGYDLNWFFAGGVRYCEQSFLSGALFQRRMVSAVRHQTSTIKAGGYIHEIWKSKGWPVLRYVPNISPYENYPGNFQHMFGHSLANALGEGILGRGTHELIVGANFTTQPDLPWSQRENISFGANTVLIRVVDRCSDCDEYPCICHVPCADCQWLSCICPVFCDLCESYHCRCWFKNLDREWLNQSREWSYSDCGRFALSILVYRTTLTQGEDLIVSKKLRNLTNYNIIIGYSATCGFQGLVSTWHSPLSRLPMGTGNGARTTVVPANGHIHEFWRPGGWQIARYIADWYDDCFSEYFMGFIGVTGWWWGIESLVEGTHELQFRASFTTDLTRVSNTNGVWPWPPDDVTFYSNTVVIKVIE